MTIRNQLENSAVLILLGGVRTDRLQALGKAPYAPRTVEDPDPLASPLKDCLPIVLHPPGVLNKAMLLLHSNGRGGGHVARLPCRSWPTSGGGGGTRGLRVE